MLPAVDHVDPPVLGSSGGWDLPVNQVKIMNEIDTSTTDGKIAILTAFSEGKQLQVRGRSSELEEFQWLDAPSPAWDFTHYDYRIKPLEFPKLPDGLEWHFGERDKVSMTPELVGDGFRLCVKGELIPAGGQVWHDDDKEWLKSIRIGEELNRYDTIRVPISIPFPKPKVMVPLEPHDISPTDALRQKDRKDFYAEHWVKIDAVNCDGPAVQLTGMGRIRIPFKTLMNEWEIKRPGEDWKPCEKESAS